MTVWRDRLTFDNCTVRENVILDGLHYQIDVYGTVWLHCSFARPMEKLPLRVSENVALVSIRWSSESQQYKVIEMGDATCNALI